MKTTISKSFDFDAAHFLTRVPPGHKCSRVHGHRYVVEVRLCGEVQEDGMVVDYARVTEAWRPIEAVVDHHLLNEIPGLENPTSEVLAPWLLQRFVDSPIGGLVVSLRVFESPETWCEVHK